MHIREGHRKQINTSSNRKEWKTGNIFLTGIKILSIAFLSTSTLIRNSKYITPFTKIPVEVSRSYIYSM